jgi:small acid-soluble spore protein I (minor)
MHPKLGSLSFRICINVKLKVANCSSSLNPHKRRLALFKKGGNIMNLNLRNAIIHNVSGNTQAELKDTIVDAIQNGEEKMLPGLGVLFEVIWKNASEQDKQDMLQALESGLK